MGSERVLALLAAFVACGGAPARLPSGGTWAIRTVARSELVVTSGRVEPGRAPRLHVDSGGMRAVVAGDASDAAELDFVYRGPSAKTTLLANGEKRRQIGLKLRAKDTCNVVYVMWHAEPTPGIFVSVKHNPFASTHAACGDRGYINVRAKSFAPVPRLRPDERHVLRAEIDGDVLRVLVDGAESWTAALPSSALTFDGPAGIRTDNGVFDFELRVAHSRRAGARHGIADAPHAARQ